MIETTVLKQTRKRTKSLRRQDVCQKILWFYARRLRNHSEAALLYAENHHVTPSVATIQHQKEHPLTKNKQTNKQQKNRARHFQDFYWSHKQSKLFLSLTDFAVLYQRFVF